MTSIAVASTSAIPSTEKVLKRLHVSGLNASITPKDLEERFGRFGDVAGVDSVGLDGLGQPRNFVYVTLSITAADLTRCLNVLQGSTYRGAKLQIAPAKPHYSVLRSTEMSSSSSSPMAPNPFTAPALLVLPAPLTTLEQEKLKLKLKRKIKKTEARDVGRCGGKECGDMRIVSVEGVEKRRVIDGKYWKVIDATANNTSSDEEDSNEGPSSKPHKHILRPLYTRPTHPIPSSLFPATPPTSKLPKKKIDKSTSKDKGKKKDEAKEKVKSAKAIKATARAKEVLREKRLEPLKRSKRMYLDPTRWGAKHLIGKEMLDSQAVEGVEGVEVPAGGEWVWSSSADEGKWEYRLNGETVLEEKVSSSRKRVEERLNAIPAYSRQFPDPVVNRQKQSRPARFDDTEPLGFDLGGGDSDSDDEGLWESLPAPEEAVEEDEDGEGLFPLRAGMTRQEQQPPRKKQRVEVEEVMEISSDEEDEDAGLFAVQLVAGDGSEDTGAGLFEAVDEAEEDAGLFGRSAFVDKESSPLFASSNGPQDMEVDQDDIQSISSDSTSSWESSSSSSADEVPTEVRVQPEVTQEEEEHQTMEQDEVDDDHISVSSASTSSWESSPSSSGSSTASVVHEEQRPITLDSDKMDVNVDEVLETSTLPLDVQQTDNSITPDLTILPTTTVTAAVTNGAATNGNAASSSSSSSAESSDSDDTSDEEPEKPEEQGGAGDQAAANGGDDKDSSDDSSSSSEEGSDDDGDSDSDDTSSEEDSSSSSSESDDEDEEPPAKTSKTGPNTKITTLKEMFAPQARAEASSFSLFSGLDLDLDLDMEEMVAGPVASSSRVQEDAPLQPLEVLAPVTSGQSFFDPDPTIPLFFPVGGEETSTGGPGPARAKAGGATGGGNWLSKPLPEGIKPFVRQETDEEMKEAWNKDKLELTREYKKRHREAVKRKKRSRLGIAEDAGL